MTRSAQELAPDPETTLPGPLTTDSLSVGFRGTAEGDKLILRDGTGREETVVATRTSVWGTLALVPGFRWARAELRRREPVFGTWLVVGLTSYVFEEVDS